MFAIVVLVTILSMHLSAEIARRRGRSVRGWLWIAAIVGPLAPPALWLLPARSGAALTPA
ncbi:MAG: hypothetical protein AB1586_28250 [Pseudomonadota bacterium]|jgi:hypothetical protein